MAGRHTRQTNPRPNDTTTTQKKIKKANAKKHKNYDI